MTPPSDAELHETELATFWLDKDGILVSISKSPKRTVKNCSENFAVARKLGNGKRIPHLVYLSPSVMPDRETREFVARELPNVYTAMAMVSKSGLGRMIMNFLFAFKAPPIPMKTFWDDVAARKWLMQYR